MKQKTSYEFFNKEPMALNYNEPKFMTLEDALQLQINSIGFSKFYPDSFFTLEMQDKGCLITRRKKPDGNLSSSREEEPLSNTNNQPF